MAAYIHHVQLCTKHGSKYVQKFVQSANFKLFAERTTDSIRQWAVRSGSAVFVINQPINIVDDCHPSEQLDNHNTSPALSPCDNKLINSGISDRVVDDGRHQIPSSCFTSSKDRHIDTVFNVAFEVPNVAKSVERAHQNGAKVVCEPTEIEDGSGKMVVASVQSCLGNVVHMLLNTADYHGVFLPGFCHAKSGTTDWNSFETSPANGGQTFTTHLDHVTFASNMGDSDHILEWYEKCFGMKRFKLSRDEDDLEGFLVKGQNVGLRMKAMEYWHCAETGLVMPSHDTQRYPKTKFVISEALPGQGANQVETFLEQHGGPGIQHIGLYTPNIIETVKVLKNTGLDFLQPPDTYYTEIGKLKEMVEVGENPEDLKNLGVLLDAESFVEEEVTPAKSCSQVSPGSEKKGHLHKYLMQIFTKPIFERDTFFLEIIQRCGATGFGAGNITALWRAVEQYMEKSNTKEGNKI